MGVRQVMKRRKIMDPAHIGVVTTAAVGLVTGLVSAYIAFRKHKNEEAVRQETFIVQELKDMMRRQDEEFEARIGRMELEYRARITELRRERDTALSRLSTCLTDFSSAVERIAIYETLLEQNGVKYPPWKAPSQGGSQPIMDAIQEGE